MSELWSQQQVWRYIHTVYPSFSQGKVLLLQSGKYIRIKYPSIAVLSYLVYIAFDNLQEHLHSRKCMLIDPKNLTSLIRKPGYLWTALKINTANGMILDKLHRFHEGFIHFLNIIRFPDTRLNVVSFTSKGKYGLLAIIFTIIE